MNGRVVIAFLAFASCVFPYAPEAVEREYPGMSDGGYTGMILVPGPRLVRSGWYGAGIHRGKLKGAIGILNVMEAGLVFPDLFDQPALEDWRTDTIGIAKIGMAPPDRFQFLPAVGGGIENNYDMKRESMFVTAEWDISILGWMFEFCGGYGTGRFLKEPFGGIGIIPGKLLGSSLKFMAEYCARKGIGGARFALSRDLRLDFGLLMDASPQNEETKGDLETWKIKMDRGLLGASKTDRATRPRAKKAVTPAI